MKRWKKAANLFLFTCVLLNCVCGCASRTKEKEESSPSTSSKFTATTNTAEGTTMKTDIATTEGAKQTTTQATSIHQNTPTWQNPSSSAGRTRTTATQSTDAAAAPVAWEGPSGYRIVVSAQADAHIQTAAKRLQSFFKEKSGEALEIVTDAQKETAKEILVGNTNRSVSSNRMASNAYAVNVKDRKLVLEGGHYLAVEKAVHQFVQQNQAIKGVYEINETFDLELKKLDKYEYVWGDEFDTETLDSSKWELGENMGGYSDTILSDSPEIVRVKDSMLRLATRRYYDPSNSLIQYATSYSVRTKHAMSFQYGYLEMRARVPFNQGAWPSFWMVSSGALGARPDPYYNVEVDIFEVFSSRSTLIPNIHKWYNKGKYAQAAEKNTQYASVVKDEEKKNRSYVFEDTDGLSDAFHIYGFEWTDKEMSMYVDGKKYMTYDLSFNFDGNTEEGAGMDMFHDPLYIIFNNHIFTEGAWWKPGDSVVNNADLPFEYDIDWIRLYQQPGVGALHLAR